MKPTAVFRAVNLLYFLTLCLMVANLLLTWLPQYVRLTLNEILFVFLPGYIFLHLSHQPVAKRVRWRWPGWQIALLALVIGAGLYPLSAMSASVLVGVLDYTSFAAPADAIPTTVSMGLLAILSYAILAPLCEEFLFRGIIQPVYETRGAKWGVLFVGFLFVAFHLSLLQGLSILLLALGLGYVNYRTQSLPASMLTHFGANGLAALVVTQQVFPTGIQNWIASLPALFGGLALAGLALLGLVRLTAGNQRDRLAALPAAEFEINTPPVRSSARGWLSMAWPLLAALAIYLPLLGVEWVFSRSPQLVSNLQAPGPALQLGASPWSAPQTWRYEIRNVADAVVGEGECRLTPTGDSMELTCSSTVQAYEVKHAQGTYASSGGTRIDQLKWQKGNGKFVSGSSTLDLQGGFGSQVDFRLGEDRIEVRYQARGQSEQSLDLPFQQTALATDPTLPLAPDYTWPWQFASIYQSEPDSGSETAGAVLRFNPYTWNNDKRTNGPLAEPRLIKVAFPADVQTPAGNFSALSVTNGERDTVWYAAVNGTLAVVKYFNGVETWLLKQ